MQSPPKRQIGGSNPLGDAIFICNYNRILYLVFDFFHVIKKESEVEIWQHLKLIKIEILR